MAGGAPAKRGLNLLLKADGRQINLGAKTAVTVEAGDVFSMRTPGGGGYGVDGEFSVANVEMEGTKYLERGSLFEYLKAQESV